MNKLIGLMCCRNEAWVLKASIPAAMKWLDHLIVLDHNSTDETPIVLRAATEIYKERVTLCHESCLDWNEADYRGRLLHMGRGMGGTHFAIIDADEIVTEPMAQIIGDRSWIKGLRLGELVRLPWIHCWRSLDKYRCDGSPFGQATVPFLFRDDPRMEYKVDADGYQLHKRVPFAPDQFPLERGLRDYLVGKGRGVLHLQHAKWTRVVVKQTLYEMDEILRYGRIRGNYKATLAEAGLQLESIPKEWWPVSPGLVDLDAVPWQSDEIERWVGLHGWDKFQASGLFTNVYPDWMRRTR